VLRELANAAYVLVDGAGRVVADPEVLDHPLSECRHIWAPSVDVAGPEGVILSQTANAAPALPRSGFFQQQHAADGAARRR